MSRRVAEVHQSTLREHQHAATGRQAPFVHLRLDLDALGAGEALQPGDVDLVVEVAHVGDDRQVLHAHQVLNGDDVLVAGSRNEDVDLGERALDRGDLEAIHGRLQRVDRIDLGDDDAGTLAAHGLGSTLADVTVACNEHHLAADENIGGAVDAVGQ